VFRMNPFHAAYKISRLTALEVFSDRNVSHHISAFRTNCSWLFKNYTFPWEYCNGRFLQIEAIMESHWWSSGLWVPTFQRNTLSPSSVLRWRQYVHPKRLYPPTSLHGVTTQKTTINIVTIIRFSDLM
jgi:hypothetical protein